MQGLPFRCSGVKLLEILSGNFDCSFVQTHPVANKGLEKDLLDDKFTSNKRRCDVSFEIVKKNNVLEIVFDATIFASVFNMFGGYGTSESIFPLLLLKTFESSSNYIKEIYVS